MMFYRFFFLSLITTLLCGCVQVSNPYTHLPPGQWRAIFKIADTDLSQGGEIAYDESKKIKDYFELPFNFEVAYEGDQMIAHLINGEERIKIEDIHFGRDKSTAKDTIQFGFTSYDTRIDGFYEENFIEGYWKVPYRGKYSIPFKAKYGQSHRFNIPENESEVYDFDGEWEVVFEFDKPDDSYPAIAVIEQDGRNLTGTFKTETGDYRFLQGNAYDNKMKLSVFDGAHAFLFSGTVQNDTIYGEFRSGNHYKSNWIAHRKKADKQVLRDPNDMTQSTATTPIAFGFPNTDGKTISLNDASYKGKVKLINIMGTWCPNCKDEIIFLQEVKEKFPDLEIISIAFERYKDPSVCLEKISQYKEKMKVDWEMLYGGYASKSETTKILGFVDKIYSYPTLLTVDENDQIIDIHTGFYGPATSEYQSFRTSFIDKLSNLSI